MKDNEDDFNELFDMLDKSPRSEYDPLWIGDNPSESMREAVSSELHASYHDNCFTKTLDEYIADPTEELARLNKYRDSSLTTNEFLMIVKEARRMREE